MAREDEIKNALAESKKPATKTYLGILLVVAILVVSYIVFSYTTQSHVNYVDNGGGTQAIQTHSDAQNQATGLTSDVQGLGDQLGGISTALGG